MGGGASGGYVTAGSNGQAYDGNAGGTTSLGSIASAAGGAAAKGCPAFSSYNATISVRFAIGGDGQHGILVPAGYMPFSMMDTSLAILATGANHVATTLVNAGVMHLAGNGQAISASSSSYNGATASGGRGGYGYGAGGGGAALAWRSDHQRAAHGGAAGTVKAVSYTLPNLNSIAVTVGAGGVQPSSNYNGGAGAPGCCAVFW